MNPFAISFALFKVTLIVFTVHILKKASINNKLNILTYQYLYLTVINFPIDELRFNQLTRRTE